MSFLGGGFSLEEDVGVFKVLELLVSFYEIRRDGHRWS